MTKSRLLIAIGFAALATPAFAQEPVGCDNFKWNVDRERALLSDAAKTQTASGDTLRAAPSAISLSLKPLEQASLPKSPERVPRSGGSYAGFVRVDASQAGDYLITLDGAAWIDVVQHDSYVRPTAFSGVTGCDGIRKSVRFRLEAAPFVVQLSALPTDSVLLALTPAP